MLGTVENAQNNREDEEYKAKNASPYEDYDDACCGMGCCGVLIMCLAALLYLALLPVAIFLSIRSIQEYERGVILRLGRVVRSKGKSSILMPGVRFVMPCTDRLLKVDLRTRSVNIPPQEVLTKDSVSCSVDAVVYMRVVEPAAALLRVDDSYRAAQFVAISSLRTVIGSATLSELLQDRETIDNKLRLMIDKATDCWGILVERVDIKVSAQIARLTFFVQRPKDVSLPSDMQRAMAAEAQATRQAKARMITAEGELAASEALTQASSRFEKSPAALHLRYLETLTTISVDNSSTVLFPLPMELLKSFASK